MCKDKRLMLDGGLIQYVIGTGGLLMIETWTLT